MSAPVCRHADPVSDFRGLNFLDPGIEAATLNGRRGATRGDRAGGAWESGVGWIDRLASRPPILFIHSAVIPVALLVPVADGHAMPLYRFDVRVDDITVEDEEGRDLPDDDTAEATATALVGA